MASDLQIAMYTLSGYPPVPASFYLDIFTPEPTQPASLETMFGAASDFPYKLLFNQYYDQVKDVWPTENLGGVSQESRDTVQAQLNRLNQYKIDFRIWNEGFVVAQDVAWRKKIAEAILSVV